MNVCESIIQSINQSILEDYPKELQTWTLGVVQRDLQPRCCRKGCGAHGDNKIFGWRVEKGMRQARSESSDSGAACVPLLVIPLGWSTRY